MPILDVTIVGPIDSGARALLAQRFADAASAVFDAPAGKTWAIIRPLEPELYAESGGEVDARAKPVFVRILQRRPPEGAERATQVEALTRALAKACGRPADKVHLIFEPPGAGRIAFGGSLID
jgi:phenylpyruvate tautomerase PptA (4-oxalocrotonate tautomerase family)